MKTVRSSQPCLLMNFVLNSAKHKFFFHVSIVKQIFYVSLFNVRNYPPEVRNIQRRKAELNITLRRMNNFDIKQKVVCNIYFTICSKHPTKSRWMLTRGRIFWWQHNYLFLKKISWNSDFELFVDINCRYHFFVKSLNH